MRTLRQFFNSAPIISENYGTFEEYACRRYIDVQQRVPPPPLFGVFGYAIAGVGSKLFDVATVVGTRRMYKSTTELDRGEGCSNTETNCPGIYVE